MSVISSSLSLSAVIAIAILSVLFARNVRGMGILSQPKAIVPAPAEADASAVFDVDTQKVPEEWPELVESLFAHQPADNSFGYSNADNVPTGPDRVQGNGVHLHADLEDVRQFLLDNCCDDCATVRKLEESDQHFDSLRMLGLASPLQR